MNRELFEDLIKSIKEAGKIQRGEVKASRVFIHEKNDRKDLLKGTKCFL